MILEKLSSALKNVKHGGIGMKMKWLVFMMSAVFLLCLSGPALADWITDDGGVNGCGDVVNHVPAYDQAHQDMVDLKDLYNRNKKSEFIKSKTMIFLEKNKQIFS